MAGTVGLGTVGGWVTYLNTKATVASTGIHNLTKNAGEIEAYTNGDSKSIILPYCMQTTLTLPAFESDGITASNKTFVFYNIKRIKIPVTYTGNAIA